MANKSQNMAEVERIFKRFDTNGDGKISSSELGDALKTLGSATSDEIQRVMTEIDTDVLSISFSRLGIDACLLTFGLLGLLLVEHFRLSSAVGFWDFTLGCHTYILAETRTAYFWATEHRSSLTVLS
ncbi:hypothetical protein HHK36_006786 [Tetracentron sinense]|uniref:EF-hand domain-containing protein n=1 Tax=Tetracentron sinense TaxID=13715 RepID=A0A835DL44_TETSI|nr:hypothetical protein HHK36_006786 [Tetracentron sinense]